MPLAQHVHAFGLNPQGIAAVELALEAGARVTASDRAPAPAEPARLAALEERGAGLTLGGHPAEIVAAADLVVAAPGIVQNAAGWHQVRDDPRFISDADLAYLAGVLQHESLLLVTGSYGKSTFSRLLERHLASREITSSRAGTREHPICALRKQDRADVVIAELGYPSLVALRHLRARCVVVLNVFAEDHTLGDDALYRRTKLLPLALQGPGDSAILGPGLEPGEGRPELDVVGELLGLVDRAALGFGLDPMRAAERANLRAWVPPGSWSTSRPRPGLTVVNCGAAKGRTPVLRAARFLEAHGRGVLLTCRDDVTVEGPELATLQAPAPAAELQPAVRRALAHPALQQGEGHLVYAPGVAGEGPGAGYTASRTQQLDACVRAHFAKEAS